MAAKKDTATPNSIGWALDVLEPYLMAADLNTRKAVGALLASWADDPDANVALIVEEVQRMLEPHDGTARSEGVSHG